MKINTSLYVHIPFCSRKCIYCDFASIVNDGLISRYFDALKREVEIIHDADDVSIFTIYFGGGTPSHVPLRYISYVMESIQSKFSLNTEEITFEINPEDINIEFCSELKSIGVNRISLGLQSTSNDILKVIRRPYTLELFMKKYEIVKRYFDNVNIDLIYTLPFEKISDVESDLKIIEKINPTHVSFYELELHEETPLYPMMTSGAIRLPSEDESELMYDLIVKTLKIFGYERYELSSWTKSKPSMHNLNYWENGQYIGVGLSAGSHFGMKRWVNTGDIVEYLGKVEKDELPYAYVSMNTIDEELSETFFMGLRLSKGINLDILRERFGNEIVNFYLKKLERFCGEILYCSSNTIKFTPDGMKFSALVFSELV